MKLILQKEKKKKNYSREHKSSTNAQDVINLVQHSRNL